MTDLTLWHEAAAAEGITLDEARRRYPTPGDVPGSDWDCGPPMGHDRKHDLGTKTLLDEIYDARTETR